ncbi:cupin domain-containing protein [Rhodococcus phenolicus]|uniref:cupin domain-containing protein n=1 Tax=Rhodococcus phenolicus TaxID=263849 RepID=UPI00082DAB25|nr:cupin domain-containing protein [Rhodococcus phenolicus]
MSGFHVERSGEGTRLSLPDAVVTVLSSGGHTEGAYELMLVQAPPGEPPPMHTEPWAKTFHLLRGRIRVRVGSASCDLGPGDSLTVAPGTANSFSVLTAEAVFLLAAAGTGMSGFFTDLDGLLREQHSSADLSSRLVSLAGRHEIRFTGGSRSP